MTATGAFPPARLCFGVLLPTRRPEGSVDAGEVISLARRAETLGYDSVWVGDSLVARPRLDPLTTLAAVATATHSLTLGTAILLGSMRPPALVAHALATIDALSGGRLLVGVGTGAPIPATAADFAAAGADYGTRIGGLYAAVDIWRAIWRGENLKSHGRYWTVTATGIEPQPVQPGGPPVWLAGESPRTLTQVGRRFDGWLPFTADPAQFRSRLEVVRAAARDAGRDPHAITPALYATATLATRPETAAELQRAFMESYYQAPYELMRGVQACLAGTVDEVVAGLGDYVVAGARHVILRIGSADLQSQLEQFAEVADRLRMVSAAAHSAMGTELGRKGPNSNAGR